MDNLADQLYEANQEHTDEIDEIGLPLPRVRNMYTHYEYLTARCFYLNPHLHTRPDGNLYNSHVLVQPTLDDIAQLANWFDRLPRQAVLYVYNRIKELAPRLDPNIIAITPTLGWDFEKHVFCDPPKGEKEFNVISDW